MVYFYDNVLVQYISAFCYIVIFLRTFAVPQTKFRIYYLLHLLTHRKRNFFNQNKLKAEIT